MNKHVHVTWEYIKMHMCMVCEFVWQWFLPTCVHVHVYNHYVVTLKETTDNCKWTVSFTTGVLKLSAFLFRGKKNKRMKETWITYM